jgi:hypothetical protein
MTARLGLGPRTARRRCSQITPASLRPSRAAMSFHGRCSSSRRRHAGLDLGDRLRSASARTGVQPSLARPSRRDCRRPSTVIRSQKLASAPFLNGLMSIDPVTGRPAAGLASLRARGMGVSTAVSRTRSALVRAVRGALRPGAPVVAEILQTLRWLQPRPSDRTEAAHAVLARVASRRAPVDGHTPMSGSRGSGRRPVTPSGRHLRRRRQGLRCLRVRERLPAVPPRGAL